MSTVIGRLAGDVADSTSRSRTAIGVVDVHRLQFQPIGSTMHHLRHHGHVAEDRVSRSGPERAASCPRS